MLKYAFYTGCSAKGVAPELYDSTKLVAEKLGMELIELEAATCCGAGAVQEKDEFMSLVINARNLALAEELGLDMLTICNTCTLMLREAKFKLDKNPEVRQAVNEVLKEAGLEYKGTIEVTHFLWEVIDAVGLDKLKSMVVRPLKEFNIAPFYGCHIIRPPYLIGYEDPDNPKSIEMLIEALGGNPVDHEARLACCGFHSFWSAEDKVTLRLTAMDTQAAKKQKADFMVTPCPLCHTQLDAMQPEAEEKIGVNIGMPVLHLPQLIGLAIGLKPKELGLHKHVISTKSIIEKVA
ncbi:CoB--CoM heterodisulfide reductase iron-sulfur subunit B family protein [Sulfurihydrogenibium azorense]|uniref:CoB--CoM heterodisulfide reductase iron-sulfur subunit B family protein n=1 Tax=Sulfurihydrogenibium azorense TaxID=309806 RepID=UPI00240A46C3|nr:CoB--CoM heterodisulfide reductase iron-sulfur subunit B family protein [Sulfurihydrogenibium azorense]MDM7274385.1 CoB--CoM heterodisulfide reductase iron-sulfur subunit B family protein [Sulfurihydrogenibium azorense]